MHRVAYDVCQVSHGAQFGTDSWPESLRHMDHQAEYLSLSSS